MPSRSRWSKAFISATARLILENLLASTKTLQLAVFLPAFSIAN